MQTKNRRPRRSTSARGLKRVGGGSARPKKHTNKRSHGGRVQGGHKKRGSGGRRSTRRIPTFDPSQFINTNPVEVKEDVYVARHTFDTFGLDQKLAQTIAKMGIVTPTPIQDQIIPEIMQDKDVIGLAETGTGKTAAFLVPLVEKAIHDDNRQVLVLAPTRELAIQIEDEFKKLSRGFKMWSVVCVGGVNINPQIRQLRRKNHFVIATPGRIMDLMDRGDFDPSQVSAVVLDEADRMLDMGFIHDMRKILSATPTDRETLFFSATMDKRAEELAQDFLQDPVTISVKKKDVSKSILQDVVRFQEDDKFDTLADMLRHVEYSRVIVFCTMKYKAKNLARDLQQAGTPSESIHGNKSHAQRQKALNAFKSGRVRVLVATDVAARGIHVDDVSHVINYDLPQTFEDYVHRIGRTGRGVKKGKALTFVQS